MRGFTVELVPEPILLELFGLRLHISPTVVTVWGIIAVVAVLALAFRLVAVPRLKDEPKGVQMLLESAVEALDKYIGGKLHGMSVSFGAYIFSLAVLMVSCAAVELLGLAPPTADASMTLALALITLFLLNYYGCRRRGLLGRLKHFKNPFNLLSDLIAPLSLACRLFGNMFAGMVIIELIYALMGKFAVGLPSVAGLYFNVFHPLIQAFIFITITLSLIEESTTTE